MKENLPKILELLMALMILLFSYFVPGQYIKLKKEQEREIVQQTVSAGETELAVNEKKAISEQQEDQEGKDVKGTAQGVIILDPGHGGADPGMVGIGSVEEKTLNLQIAKCLQECLELQGFTVYLTRTEDAGLYDAGTTNKKAQDMQRRCALIEEKQPLLTVSIHQNSYSDGAVCGPQVFYFEHSQEAEKLASCVQNQLNTRLSIARPRVIKSNENYYILKRSPSVTVLVECGFLSNSEEAEKLQTEEYQQQIAAAICGGILEYLGYNFGA